MKCLVSVFAIAVVALSAAQLSPRPGQGGPVKPKHRSQGPVSSAPVTQAEAHAVFDRIQKLFASVTEKSYPGAVGITESATPVTREAVVGEFARLYNATRPHFKLTPTKIAFDRGLLKIGAGEKANLETLIAAGCVAKVGPLATGPKDTLTVPQFGDAVGFFISRIAQMVHMPSPKWTPALGAGSGN